MSASDAPNVWASPPTAVALGPTEVHVWRLNLVQSEAVVQRYRDVLSPDERERADRLHFLQDRNRFVIARGVMRETLAAYLKIGPTKLSFNYSQYGKPELKDELNSPGLRFNLSHSARAPFLAIQSNRTLGIDIEVVRPDLVSEGLAYRFFSVQEAATLRSL